MPFGRVAETSRASAPGRRALLLSGVPALLIPLVGCCLPVGGWFDSAPVRVVKAFYRHVERLEIQKALELLSQRLRSRIGDAKLSPGLEKQGRKIRSKGGIKQIEIVHEEETGDVAKVAVVVVYGNGERSPDDNKLVRENGAWHLDADK